MTVHKKTRSPMTLDSPHILVYKSTSVRSFYNTRRKTQMEAIATANAGLRLGLIQKEQKTGLGVGLDPHYDPASPFNAEFYSQFAKKRPDLEELFGCLFVVSQHHLRTYLTAQSQGLTAKFLAGLTSYFMDLIDIYWDADLRVFKPQAAFYERLPWGMLILEILNAHIDSLTKRDKRRTFAMLDAKRGDIDSTQAPYYKAYLSNSLDADIPGLSNRFNFDAMTVTTWMGEDVLTPGLPYFFTGKGAIVVTRSSNPSGTTLQDAYLAANPHTKLLEKQEPFRLSSSEWEHISNTIGRGMPTVHEVMLYLTEKFSEKHGLNQEGVSPLFSVMGSTVKMTDSFRLLRPYAIPLIPGFGAQGGKFENVMPLAIKNGPLAGHIGILASSRGMNYAWMKKAGGSGDPKNLRDDTLTAIERFRKLEKEAYEIANVFYPFS